MKPPSQKQRRADEYSDESIEDEYSPINSKDRTDYLRLLYSGQGNSIPDEKFRPPPRQEVSSQNRKRNTCADAEANVNANNGDEGRKRRCSDDENDSPPQAKKKMMSDDDRKYYDNLKLLYAGNGHLIPDESLWPPKRLTHEQQGAAYKMMEKMGYAQFPGNFQKAF